MFELEYKAEELRQVVNELVPTYQRGSILALIKDTTIDVEGVDLLGMTLTGENLKGGFIFRTGGSHQKENLGLWNAIKMQLYELLCTKSKKFSELRAEGTVTIKQIVLILSTALASQFNLTAGVVSGAVVLALMAAMTLGTHAWCEVNRPI